MRDKSEKNIQVIKYRKRSQLYIYIYIKKIELLLEIEINHSLSIVYNIL